MPRPPGYQGLDSEAYRLFRSYGMAERGELTGHNLTVDNIIAGYPYGADGERIETTLDDELVEHYLAARARKLRLTDYLLRHAESFAACVVGVDDSAARISVQTNEIRYLQRLLGKNCALFCGTDELGTDGLYACLCRLRRMEQPPVRALFRRL